MCSQVLCVRAFACNSVMLVLKMFGVGCGQKVVCTSLKRKHFFFFFPPCRKAKHIVDIFIPMSNLRLICFRANCNWLFIKR